MKRIPTRALVVLAVAVVAIAALAGCASTPGKPVVAPITRSAGSLLGKTVKLPLDTILNITTGGLSVTSYEGVVQDTSIAKFTPGRKTSTAQFNPGITPLKVGETMVTLKNANGGIQWVTFKLDVVSG
jgi:hypothetical protein